MIKNPKKIGTIALFLLLMLLPTVINDANALSREEMREISEEMRELPPKYGGIFILSMGDPRHLNPSINTQSGPDAVGSQIYDGLLDYNPWTLEPIPDMAESWEISDDGLTYTFHLRQNATWHDGVPVTSADVKFTFEDVILPYHPRAKTVFFVVESFEAPDDYTFVMHLEYPFAPLIKFLSIYYTGILPKHLWEGTDILTNPLNWEPIGSGPFIFKEWVKGSHIRLVRNPNYWKKDQPYLDEIIYRNLPDVASTMLAFENHEIDYTTSTPYSDIDRLAAIEGVGIAFAGKGAAQVLCFLNLQSPYLSKLEVRQAIAHAIDKEQIAELATFGICEASIGPVHQELGEFYNPDVVKYEYDPNLAERMLDEAGFPRGADGKRFKLDLITHGTGKEYTSTYEIMREQLSEVGIELNVNIYDSATTNELLWIKREFDICIRYMATGPDPMIMGTVLHSSNIVFETNPRTGSQNIMPWNNSRVDELLDLAIREQDPEKRVEYYHEIQEIVAEELPIYYMIQMEYEHIYWDEWVGVPAGPFAGRKTSYDNIWTTEGNDVSIRTATETIASIEAQLAALADEEYDVTAANAKLDDAKEALEDKEYDNANDLANEVLNLAEPPVDEPPDDDSDKVDYTMYYLAAAIVIIAVAAYWYMKKSAT